jgi:regulator of RNase E activity RraA
MSWSLQLLQVNIRWGLPHVPPNASLLLVIQDCTNAVWGGLMSAGAKSRQLNGVVINGRCRDIAEHRKLGFPVSRVTIRLWDCAQYSPAP